MHNKYIEDTDSVTVTIVVPKAKNIYNNIVKSGEWGKVDPRNTKLLALQTQFEKYKKANRNRNSNAKSFDAMLTKKKPYELNPLRKIKKGGLWLLIANSIGGFLIILILKELSMDYAWSINPNIIISGRRRKMKEL